MNQCTVSMVCFFLYPLPTASSHTAADILALSASIFYPSSSSSSSFSFFFFSPEEVEHIYKRAIERVCENGSKLTSVEPQWLLVFCFFSPPLPSSSSSFTSRAPQFNQDGEGSGAATDGLSDLSSLLNTYSSKAHCAESHCGREV